MGALIETETVILTLQPLKREIPPNIDLYPLLWRLFCNSNK